MMDYCMKDGSYIVHGVPPNRGSGANSNGNQMSSSTSAPMKRMVEMLQTEKSLRLIYQEYPHLYLTHRKRLHELLQDKQKWDAEDVLQSQQRQWAPPLLHHQPNELNTTLAIWLDSNIKKPRKFKQQHLWITGSPGIGKTTLLEALRYSLVSFEPEQSTHYWDGYSNDVDIVIFDEYRGGRTIRDLNAFLDGSKQTLTVRYGTATKVANPPVIFCSNYSIDNCYNKSDWISISAFKLRVQELNFGETLIRLNWPLSPGEDPSPENSEDEEEE